MNIIIFSHLYPMMGRNVCLLFLAFMKYPHPISRGFGDFFASLPLTVAINVIKINTHT